MPPAMSRFGPQISSGTFSQLHQPHLQQRNTQHQQHPGSAGLAPPSFNSGGQQAFPQSAPSSNINFAPPTNGTNGLAGGFGGATGLGGGGTGLGSRQAMMGFAHGAAIQEQQALRRSSGGAKGQMKSRIRDVWRGNLAQEMDTLRGLVEDYPYVSMDTEFPGIVARPMGQFTTKADYHYQTLRCNVDLLKVIQLGITLFNENGEMPLPFPPENQSNSSAPYPHSSTITPCTWQFNFQFSLEQDMYAQGSVEFLTNAGLDFARHEKDGIDPLDFGALLISSGLVLVDDVRWISFHSGYDFAYLVKIMLQKPLPEDEIEYRKLLSIFFPSIYDIKYMVKHAQRTQAANSSPLTAAASSTLTNLGQKSGLQDLADELQLKRQGNAHTAGSDSLLTGRVFWDLRKNIFNGHIEDDKYLGQVWGLNGMGLGGAPGGMTFTAGTHDTMGAPNLNGATIYSNSGAPSTPNTNHIGLASTPSHQSQNSGGMNTLTPGGAGGVFGGFRYGKS